MTKFQKVYKIFVASPSDLKDEREALEVVIKELNDIWNNTIGISIQLIRWETHSYPGFGDDAQDVINNTIDDDYDIFIGILWTRFGTPTKRYDSGTLEEFEKAYNRFKDNPDDIRLMIYFKDASINPYDIDLDQFQKVNEFKKRIEQLGCLHWSFNNLESFSRFIRIHLSQHIFGKNIEQDNPIITSEITTPIENSKITQSLVNIIDEDEGFYDLIEIGTVNFKEVVAVSERLTSSMNTLTTCLTNDSTELKSLNAKEDPGYLKKAKSIINHTAQELELLSDRIKSEIPIFKKSYSLAMDSYGKAATLLNDFDEDSKEQVEAAYNVTRDIKFSLIGTKEAMIEFKNALHDQPRITTRFNRAKRNALDTLDEFIEEIISSEKMTDEVENLMFNLL